MSDKVYELSKIESDAEFDKWCPAFNEDHKLIGYFPLYKRNMLIKVTFSQHS